MKLFRIVIISCMFFNFLTHTYRITIIGCGYVGLTMAGIFGRGGHKVVCVDTDREKITQLQQKQLNYIYEPLLADLLFDATHDISFISNLDQALDAEIFYICVGTPTDAFGNCDYSYVYKVFHDIVTHCALEKSEKIICIKSTVAPKTVRPLQDYLTQNNMYHLYVVFNPEFMREGSAIHDIYYHNPVMIGGESEYACALIESLYKSILPKDPIIIRTSYESAELIKYAWNSFSALRITFVNELAVLCRALHADITSVVKGFSLSEEILPTDKLRPGPGYGGSCFPKDTRACAKILKYHGIYPSLVHQTIQSNDDHVRRLINDIFALLGNSDQKTTVAILGLSFKANTDDIRCAPSIEIIKALRAKGISIRAYDPKAMSSMRLLFPDITYCKSPYDAVQDVDGILVLTEWRELKNLDLSLVAQMCRQKIIFDTHNMYEPEALTKYGFTFMNMGAL